MRFPFLSLVAGLSIVATGLAPAAPRGRLIWSDEFNGTGEPDPAKWNREHGFIRNQELQFYTTNRLENATLEGGSLRITARRESFETARYTSACLTTENRFAMKYGRLEVRAKIPTGRGFWPAIWLLGTNIHAVGWPKCGEIDVMENVGYQPEEIVCTVHTGKAPGDPRDHFSSGGRVSVPKVWEGFHVYALDWHPDRIELSCDGKIVHRFAREGQPPEHWPFDQPHYLLLNLAIGGTWGGQKGIDDEKFPQSMDVDYVRVYELSPP
jgi:beta-glucanase (GH16 family)